MTAPWEKYGSAPAASTTEAPWEKFNKPKMDSMGRLVMRPQVEEGALKSSAVGQLLGNTDLGSTLIDAAVKLPGMAIPQLAQWNKTRNADREYIAEQRKDSMAFQGNRIAGNVFSTLPVGGTLAAGLKAGAPQLAKIGVSAPVVNNLAAALSSGGFRAGQATGAAGLGTKVLGGAITGGTSAGLVDQNSKAMGTGIGAALPVAFATMGAAGRAVGGLVRPFYAKGQDKITRDAFMQFAENPAALANMRAMPEVIPGSDPTTVAVTGDTGLAGVSRTLQSSSPKYATDLAARGTAQNAARTRAIEEIAGNPGKISAAKEARDLATGSMRESVLDRAGNVQSQAMLDAMDGMLKNPNNAGKLAQQAVSEFRSRIAQFTDGGAINARALYAIRKDVNDVLSGKLQGESGNLKYASSQLVKVKELIDDAIDKSSRSVSPGGTGGIATVGSNLRVRGSAGSGPTSTWSQYLEEYTKQSKPIDQMEMLDGIMRRAQTGTVDKQGNYIISAAKLNSIIKNETPDLVKKLTPEQLKVLRGLAADLNASQLALNSGRSVGSDTVQKSATHNLLTASLGQKIGGSTPSQAILGRLLQIPYGTADKQIMERMGNALLDPTEMSRIMATPGGNALLRAIGGNAAIGTTKVAPVAIPRR